jgi:hypothetical protein
MKPEPKNRDKIRMKKREKTKGDKKINIKTGENNKTLSQKKRKGVNKNKKL